MLHKCKSSNGSATRGRDPCRRKRRSRSWVTSCTSRPKVSERVNAGASCHALPVTGVRSVRADSALHHVWVYMALQCWRRSCSISRTTRAARASSRKTCCFARASTPAWYAEREHQVWFVYTFGINRLAEPLPNRFDTHCVMLVPDEAAAKVPARAPRLGNERFCCCRRLQTTHSTESTWLGRLVTSSLSLLSSVPFIRCYPPVSVLRGTCRRRCNLRLYYT